MSDNGQIKAARVGEHLARSLRRVREGRHVTYTELVKRLEEIGHPIPILGLRRIERGERRVDVDDLIALGRALSVPPVLLLFPVDEPGAVVELVPGVVADPDAALAWFAGEGPLPAGSEPDASWEADAAPVLLRRRHQQLVSDWLTAQQLARRLAPDKQSSEELNYKLLTIAEDQLTALRAEMRRLGIVPPTLPPGLAQTIADTGRVLYERVEGRKVVERVDTIRDGYEDLRLAQSPNWQRVDTSPKAPRP